MSNNKKYKEAFVSYVAGQDFDWFGTIGIGWCPSEEETLRRLTLIDAMFSKKYLLGQYHKLPSDARFLTLVAFEGEQATGDLHAHFLVRIPTPLRNGTRSMLLNAFPFQFRFFWDGLSCRTGSQSTATTSACFGRTLPIKFEPINLARKIYPIKEVQAFKSRFYVIPPPQRHKFANENLNAIRNRDKQKRAALSLA
jgi:hypothetical protein